MKKLLALSALLLSVSMLFSSCCCPVTDLVDQVSNLIAPSIEGTWECYEDGSYITFEFESDGTGTLKVDDESALINWETDDGELFVEASLYGYTGTLFDWYDYTLSGNTLTVYTDYTTFEFTRQ